jgi:asparagine synthase (glutamine-hydrolysing)
MNITRHGGIFSRQRGFPSAARFCAELEAHLLCPDSSVNIQTTKVTDVAMSVKGANNYVLPSQPVTINNKVLLAWDGRLDNRSSIATACGCGAHEALEDAALVAQAYSILGSAVWSRLVGDYALACWDSAAGELYLVRDPFGTRPLYYYVDDSMAVWCSELTYFSDCFADRLVLDEDYLASYLLAMEDQGRTPYRGIASALPGYITVISGKKVSHRQFWDPSWCGEVRLQSDADYEARFRELFAQSVQRRLRTTGVPVAELSGGLDSSSIVCMADQLLETEANQEKIVTISYLYDGSRGSDERRFIKEIEQFREMRTRLLEDHNIAGLSTAPRASRPSCLEIFHDMFAGLQRILESVDAGSLLSGFGGDQVTLNEDVLCPDLISLLKRGELLAAFRIAKHWAHVHKTTTIQLLWTGLIRPLLFICLQRPLTSGIFFPRSWMGPLLVARVESQARAMNRRSRRRLLDPARQQQCNLLDGAVSFTSQCYYREQGCGDVSYPFLDRCLIEFLIGVPADQKLRPTESRSLHRRAMKGILPESVRLRKGKQGPEESLLKALAHDWPNLLTVFRNAEVSQCGYIDGDAFLNDLFRAKHGICYGLPSLVRVLSLELWLRARTALGSQTRTAGACVSPATAEAT